MEVQETMKITYYLQLLFYIEKGTKNMKICIITRCRYTPICVVPGLVPLGNQVSQNTFDLVLETSMMGFHQWEM